MGSGTGSAAEAYRLLIAEVYELAGASRGTSESIARPLGLTTARWHLLSVVSDGPRTVSQAARRLGQARQSVQRVADDLLATGMLVARADPADARAPLLEITAAGRRALDAVVAESDRSRSAVLGRAGLGVGELDRARAVLQQLTRAMGEPPPRAP